MIEDIVDVVGRRRRPVAAKDERAECAQLPIRLVEERALVDLIQNELRAASTIDVEVAGCVRREGIGRNRRECQVRIDGSQRGARLAVAVHGRGGANGIVDPIQAG